MISELPGSSDDEISDDQTHALDGIMENGLTLRENIDKVVFFLLAYYESDEFLNLLFRKPSGEFADVLQLCSYLPKLNGKLKALRVSHNVRLYAMWIEHHEAPEGFCLILFWDAESGFTTMAHYNKQFFEKQQGS